MNAPLNPDRRGLLGLSAGAALSTACRPAAAAVADRAKVDVRAMGALGDGVHDDTAAFNRATDAAAPWSPALERLIVVPPGRYRLNGTVYIRKGQELAGSGYATQIDARGVSSGTFVLGRAAGASERDPGGSPVAIGGFRALGSAPRAPFIDVTAEGFSIEHLFLSAVGTGIAVHGADGIIRDVIIDQALNGIVFERAQNVLVSGFYTYLANYAFTARSDCFDIVVANSLFAYSRNAAILFAERASQLRGLTFTGCNFVENEQFASFSGFVQSRASHVDAVFTGCQFRNWPGFAVEQGGGIDVALSFDSCVFDARATNPAYNQSTTARGLTTGLDGRFRFRGCEFRNLFGELARVRPGGAQLSLNGGLAEGCQTALLDVQDATARVRVRNFDGLAHMDGAAWAIPSWTGATWRIAARLVDAAGDAVFEEVVVIDGSKTPQVQHVTGPAPAVLRIRPRRGAARAILVDVVPGRWHLASLDVASAG